MSYEQPSQIMKKKKKRGNTTPNEKKNSYKEGKKAEVEEKMFSTDAPKTSDISHCNS